MHLLGERILGISILTLLALLVLVKRVTTGSILDKPKGNPVVRHPMYTAALSIALGPSCLTQSLACLFVFCTYLVLILLLIPVEEDGLRKVYGDQYVAYQRETRRLLPSVY